MLRGANITIHPALMSRVDGCGTGTGPMAGDQFVEFTIDFRTRAVRKSTHHVCGACRRRDAETASRIPSMARWSLDTR